MIRFFNKNLLLVLGLGFFLSPLAANAEIVFMVQLGSFDSEKKAAAHWQSLVSTFPDLFDSLNYSPNEVVIKPDNFVSYRTQAGPIPTRDEAEGICSELVRSGYECRVTETAMFFNSDKEITQSSVKQPKERYIPFAKQSDYVAPQSVPSSSKDIAQMQNKSDAVVVGGNAVQGTIAAGEAIPVPLSSNKVAVNNPYLEKGNVLMNAHPADSSRSNSFWADISYFSSEAAAAQYVKILKQRDPLLPAKLRVRITRPYGVVTGKKRLSLRMRPFVTTRPILRLCSLTRSDNMRCRAVKDIGGSVRNTDRYSNRRNARKTPANYKGYRGASGAYTTKAGGSKYSNNVVSTSNNEAYYVQLGTFLSPKAANDKWQQLQTRHNKILDNINNDIVVPRKGSSASRLFRLRAGPFDNMNKAYNLCGRLKAQGTLCIVVK